jgi:Caspase domain
VVSGGPPAPRWFWSGKAMSDLVKSGGEAPIVRADRIGLAHVLSIGVSRQLPSSGFVQLSQCENDALAIRDCFSDYRQLFADKSHIKPLTTKGDSVSRGAIIAAVRHISTAAGPRNRLLFFFSGHGHRINDKLYLVPEDAYDAKDPACLVEFDQLLALLDNSQAFQKIVILDCCWSGPAISFEKGFEPAQISQKFLNEYLCRTKGVVVLSSSSDSQTSTAKSPDPRYSLFTYHLKAALSGATEALDGNYLTLHGLYEYVSVRVRRESKSHHKTQDPVLESKSTGVILLGDFTPTLIQSPLALNQSPVTSVNFLDSETLRTKDVLTAIRNWTYSAEYLAGKVNDNLADHFEEELGRAVARLKNTFDFPDDDVYADGAGIRFPGGHYWLEYVADDKRSGLLMRHVTFSETWFSDPREIADVLNELELHPTELKLELSKEIDLKSVVPGIKAAGWKLTSDLAHKAEFSQGTFRLAIENDAITFRGFLPSELFGDAESKQSQLAGGILMLLAGPHGSS